MYKILENIGVEVENIDDAAFHNFTASGKNGIIGGILDECRIVLASSTSIAISTGELLIQGFRVKITQVRDFILQPNAFPENPQDWQFVAQIMLNSDKSVFFNMFIRPVMPLTKDSLFVDNFGTYEVELATFKFSNEGITDLVKKIQVLSTESILPLNGKAGQLLVKTDDSEFSAEWKTPDYATNSSVRDIYAILTGTGLVLEETVEDSYLGRKTGGTLDIIDGALTRVEKIDGDTVNVDGVLYSTSFKGVKSRGKNLIDIDKLVGGALVKNADGTYTITKNGGNRFSARAYVEIPHTATIGNTIVTNSIEIIESTVSDNRIAAQFFYDKDGSGSQSVGFAEPTTSSAGNPNGFKKDVVMVDLYLNHSETDGAYIKFRNLMTRYGNANQISYDYEPYKEDTSFSLDSAVTLDKWDYIDVKRKKLVRQTGTKVYSTSDLSTVSLVTTSSTAYMYTLQKPTDIYYYDNTSGVGSTEQTSVFITDKYISNVSGDVGCIYSGVTTGGTFCVNLPTTINTVSLAQAELLGLTVKYKLATPIETDIDIPDDYVARLNGVEIIDDEGRTYTDLMVANGSVPKPKITQTYYTKV